MKRTAVVAFVWVLGGLGCAARPATGRSTTPASQAGMPEGAPREALAWADFSPATFARAKAERKFIVMDGSAEWCHWCHVMEATSYHDPEVRKILDRSFISIKVDVDSRPDIEERYGAWGWPATVLFSPDAEELGKYRGYLAPDDFEEILQGVVDGQAKVDHAAKTPATTPPSAPLAEETLAWIEHFVDASLAEFYDDKQGGWGRTQKAPIAWDNAWALDRARAGDAGMKDRALFTLEAQKAIIDPVWGGIYQYSTNGDWSHPHFEKLMPFEAGALDNYASAYLLTGDRKWLDTAGVMRRYLDAFLLGPDGGFYVTQDADLNAHDSTKKFLSGHDYYAKGDAERRALGIPRVDTHEYAKDNGLAIAAYATLYEATCQAGACDESVKATASKAAARIRATHASPKGGVTHDVSGDDHPGSRVLHLGDNAAFAWGLLRLYDVTRSPENLKAAQQIADFMLRELLDPKGSGFYASSLDTDAVGVFAERRVPVEENVMAARALAKLARAVPGGRETYARGIDAALRAVTEPAAILSRGRMIGDLLLALEETKGVRGMPR